MLGVIRLSPSGPPITNEDGGQAEPGPGMQLRLAETTASTAMAAFTDSFANIVDINSNPVQVSLTSPDPKKRYKINFHCDMDQPTGAAATAHLQFTVAYDGVTFSALETNTHALLANEERECSLDIPMTLGEDLFVPVPAAAASMTVRVQGKSTVTGTAQIPGGAQKNIWLSLAELL